MARIAGIKLHKTPSGEIKSATIDMKKHGELLKPLLEKVGAVVEDDFDKRWKELQVTGYTVEEFRERLLAHNRKLWKITIPR